MHLANAMNVGLCVCCWAILSTACARSQAKNQNGLPDPELIHTSNTPESIHMRALHRPEEIPTSITVGYFIAAKYGSKTGKKVREIQDLLPHARVVYVSATGKLARPNAGDSTALLRHVFVLLKAHRSWRSSAICRG